MPWQKTAAATRPAERLWPSCVCVCVSLCRSSVEGAGGGSWWNVTLPAFLNVLKAAESEDQRAEPPSAADL